MASVAQVRANRLNAQKSTGPRTPEGKAVVAQNAVKHGLLARQVVIRGEDPGEFELFRDRMVQDLDPAGSLESLLAERVAHLGWRLRRAERLDRAAWTALETDYAAREASRPPTLRRPQGEAQDDQESVLARVVVEDFGDARLLDRLLGYERRIENSLYRTVGELHKRRLLREVESSEYRLQAGRESGPSEDEKVCRAHPTDETPCGVTTNGAGPEGTSCETKPIEAGSSEDHTSGAAPEELGRGRPSHEEASDDATTNGTSCEIEPMDVGDLDSGGPGGEAEETGRGRPGYEEPPYGVSTNGGEGEEPFDETKPMEGPGPRVEGTRGQDEKVCGAHPTGETPYGITTNGAPVDPPASNLTLETSNSAEGRSCQTKPIGDGEEPSCAGPFSRA